MLKFITGFVLGVLTATAFAAGTTTNLAQVPQRAFNCEAAIDRLLALHTQIANRCPIRDYNK